MDVKNIVIDVGNDLKKVDINYQDLPPFISVEIDGVSFSAEADSLFECFIRLREKLPYVNFFCKGAKVNVHPSRMSSQMSSGLMAYELEIGRQALRKDMVNIFDYDDTNLTNDPNAQHEFFRLWIASLQKE